MEDMDSSVRNYATAYEDYVTLLSDGESDIELQEVLEASLR